MENDEMNDGEEFESPLDRVTRNLVGLQTL